MKPRTTGALTVASVAAVAALLAFVLRPAVVETVYPLENAADLFSRQVWTRVVGLFKGAESRAENARLRREVSELLIAKDELAKLAAENGRLRRALGYVEREAHRWVAAAVISTGGGAANVRKTVRIGKGTLAGVAKGAVVVVPEGLVGRIVAVTPHTAEVLLITDDSVRVACEIETAAAVKPRGVLYGGGDLLLMKHIVSREPIPPRARVITSGLGGVYPRGIEVGTWLDRGEVLPSVEFPALEDVFVSCEK